MRKTVIILIGLVLSAWTIALGFERDIGIQGKRFVSQKPPFTLNLHSEFRQIHSFSHENPGENSLTRAYFLIKTKGKQVEEMFIIQISDKTNPQAGPMTAPPLKPYTEKRLYSKGEVKKGGIEVVYMIQLMAWNPESPSLQPIVKKGIIIPSRWALQGQFMFVYQGEHAVLIRYSRDVHSFGLKVSEEGKDWNKDSYSKNEKRTYETFQKAFMEMIDSIHFKTP